VSRDNLRPIPKLVIEEMDVHGTAGTTFFDVATVPNDVTAAGDPVGDNSADKIYSRLHASSIPLYGTGVQGTDVRGYGNFSNNAASWNGLAPEKTLQNPIDRNSRAYLTMRHDEPKFEEDRRYLITVTGDDNVGPTVELPGTTYPDGEVFYPIRHLSYSLYYHPTAKTVADCPSDVKGTFSGTYASVRAQVRDALDMAKGNRIEAAKILGVGRSTLYRYLKDHSL